jgi:hypothetical protein
MPEQVIAMKKNIRVFQFLKATGRLGGGSVALALVLFGISIYEHLIEKNLSAYWLVLAAGVFFAFGAYDAWRSADSALAQEVGKSTKPLLKIELVRAFFDVSKVGNQNQLQTHIYTYLKLTNLTAPATLIRDGSLVLTVDGGRYTGIGHDATTTGNALEHVTDFKLGGEASTDVFGNTLSQFPRLTSRINAENPLQRGITQEGFFVFAFPDLADWNREQPYLMEATDAVLSLRDSFDGMHSVQLMHLKIPNGVLTTSGRFPLAGVFS